jgi:hypothetical protein
MFFVILVWRNLKTMGPGADTLRIQYSTVYQERRFGFQELAARYTSSSQNAVRTVSRTWFNVIGLYATLSCEGTYAVVPG